MSGPERLPRPPPRWRYAEAFPRLVATDALKHWQRGRPHCWWRDEHFELAGRGYVQWQSTTSLSLAFELKGRAHQVAGANLVMLEAGYQRAGRSARVMFVCPGCEANKGLLLIIDWELRCAACANLRNKSAVVPRRLRARETLAHINAVIARGRPRSMRQAAYQQLVDARRQILSDFPGLSDTGFTPLPEYRRAEWHAELFPGM